MLTHVYEWLINVAWIKVTKENIEHKQFRDQMHKQDGGQTKTIYCSIMQALFLFIIYIFSSLQKGLRIQIQVVKEQPPEHHDP